MKKMFISLFLALTLVSSVYAGGISIPRVESVTNPTINGFTVNAKSIPAFTGNREWSIRFSSTTNVWYEIKNMPAVRSTTDSTPAPRNCTESSDMDCAIRITDYQLRDNQIKCGTRYSVVFRVTSLDQANTRADSPAVMINTPICSQTGVLGVTVPGLTQKDDTTMTLTARANISGFSGEQEAEFFFGIKEGDSQDVQITEYRSLGKKSGLSSIDFAADIPDLDCKKKYVYKIKVKVGSIETVVPSGTGVYRTGNTFECSTSLGTTTSTTQTEGPNIYTFLTPLPLGEGLATTSSVVIGAASETSQNGVLGILQRIFTIMLVAAIILAVVFMIIGGARYATGDMISAKIGGKEIITNAITGLLFALLSWLLLNIVNPDLLRFTLSIPSIGKKLTYGTSTPPVGGGSINTIPGEGCPVGTSDAECYRLIMADEPDKRAALSAANITINAGPCASPDPNVFGCTNVGLLNATTLANLIQVKTDCDCALKITGGTEYWLHSSGGDHKKFIAVDLDIRNNTVNSFIRSKTKVQSPQSFCNEEYIYKGLRFCDEKVTNPDNVHWHVVAVTSTGGGTTGGELIKFENIGKNDLGVWGKASRQQISESEIGALASSARVRTWYAEVQRVAGINSKILAAIIMVESSGDPTKVRIEPDGRKSCGLGQLLTDTAKRLDTTLSNKSVEEICTALKEPNYNIRLSNQHYVSLDGDFKKKVAAYNGGTGNQGATGASANCADLMRFECPWDSSGCYEPSRPNDRPTNTSCTVNTGYEVTRFYVDKVKQISDQLR